jgi:hypothetical protein
MSTRAGAEMSVPAASVRGCNEKKRMPIAISLKIFVMGKTRDEGEISRGGNIEYLSPLVGVKVY